LSSYSSPNNLALARGELSVALLAIATGVATSKITTDTKNAFDGAERLMKRAKLCYLSFLPDPMPMLSFFALSSQEGFHRLTLTHNKQQY
jgi:hypothetical protein